MSRRHFLATLLAAVGAGAGSLLFQSGKAPLPLGELKGPNLALGHRLRTQDFPTPTDRRRVPIVIVGGGVAGLAAAWHLTKQGVTDFELLELETEAGGNAKGGRNAVSAYPWGAHYLPFPAPEARDLRELLGDLGVITGDPFVERPVYAERYVCFAPQERLYLHGRWQEGLVPNHGIPARDRAQIQRFLALMKGFEEYRTPGGEKGFALPMAASSQTPELLALDRQSMVQFLWRLGLDSPFLHGYVDYACRDDFGTHAADTSAWAGVHYFASRDGGAAGVDADTVLTWPEGLQFLTERMRERIGSPLRTSALVYRLEESPKGVALHVFLPSENRSVRLDAEQIIWAAPSFQLARVQVSPPPALVEALKAFEYAPWLVANLTLLEPPHDRGGAPLSWDNAIYDSPALGYVVADHQRLSRRTGGTVLTWYHALASQRPTTARQDLLSTPYATQAAFILQDLERVHPEIRDLVTRMDLFRHGHAMIRPRPGFLFGDARRAVLAHQGRIHLANSDLSGFSLFEEAHHRGTAAARAVAAAAGQ
jgi:monoamine oxidase